MTFLSPQAAVVFIEAGRAIFTAQSSKTGHHYTFKVKSWENIWSVYRLTGQGEYAYLGVIKPDGSFVTTKRSPVADMALTAFRFVWYNLKMHNRFPPDCDLKHEGKCGRCGRRLTHPASLATGLGPECVTFTAF